MKMGHSVLMIQERAHCESEGHVISLGAKERWDVHAWAHYAATRWPQVPIYLCGVSMGASTVLLAMETDLPKNVKGIIADAGYSSGSAILGSILRRHHCLFLYPCMALGALLFGHFSIADTNVLRVVKKAELPILLIHGEEDHLVPCEMGREIAAANPEQVEIHTFPEAGHVMSYLIDGERYEAYLQAFVERTNC